MLFTFEKSHSLGIEFSTTRFKQATEVKKMNNDICFKKILITGGVGDFLAIDSFLSCNQKRNIEKIILSTRASNEIKSLFDVKNTYYSKLIKIFRAI